MLAENLQKLFKEGVIREVNLNAMHLEEGRNK